MSKNDSNNSTSLVSLGNLGKLAALLISLITIGSMLGSVTNNYVEKSDYNLAIEKIHITLEQTERMQKNNKVIQIERRIQTIENEPDTAVNKELLNSAKIDLAEIKTAIQLLNSSIDARIKNQKILEAK